jgi:hypothetical protein
MDTGTPLSSPCTKKPGEAAVIVVPRLYPRQRRDMKEVGRRSPSAR